MSKLRVVVLISGNGSNLQALLDQAAPHYEIVFVLSNKASAYGLTRAEQHAIPHSSLSHNDFATRELFDQAMIQEIDQHQPDLVVLAGFMRILSDAFVIHYEGRMLNIHPSLLPKYKGLNTHQRALDNGDTTHGVSVHFVSPDLDSGAIIAQASTPIRTNDTAESLAQRIHELEHKLYPMVVEWFATAKLSYHQSHAILDGTPIKSIPQFDILNLT